LYPVDFSDGRANRSIQPDGWIQLLPVSTGFHQLPAVWEDAAERAGRLITSSHHVATFCRIISKRLDVACCRAVHKLMHLPLRTMRRHSETMWQRPERKGSETDNDASFTQGSLEEAIFPTGPAADLAASLPQARAALPYAFLMVLWCLHVGRNTNVLKVDRCSHCGSSQGTQTC
jgi:hypothetical protein